MLDSETKILKLENALQETQEEIETLEDKISELEENNSELLSENDELGSDHDNLQTELHEIRMWLSDLGLEDEIDREKFEQKSSDLWEFNNEVCEIFGLSPDGYNNVWSLIRDIEVKYNVCRDS